MGGPRPRQIWFWKILTKTWASVRNRRMTPPPLLGHCDNVMETKTSMTCNISCNQLLNFCLRRLVFIVQNTFTPRPPNAHMDHRMCIVLLCLLRLPSSIHAYTHWSHLLGFSPLCVIICFLRLLFPMDV